MPSETKAFEFGVFRLEAGERRLTRGGYPVPLPGRVFDTLCILVRNHGRLVTKDELMAAVWPDSVVEETNLNHNICILRRALGEKATGQKYIETVPRQGYRFVAEVKKVDDPARSSIAHAWDSFQNELVSSGTEAAPLVQSSDSPSPPGIPAPEQGPVPVGRPRRLLSPVIIALMAIAG
ncbi:MAG: transcriptional regulator, partial [Acidobacteriota bacterium]